MDDARLYGAPCSLLAFRRVDDHLDVASSLFVLRHRGFPFPFYPLLECLQGQPFLAGQLLFENFPQVHQRPHLLRMVPLIFHRLTAFFPSSDSRHLMPCHLQRVSECAKRSFFPRPKFSPIVAFFPPMVPLVAARGLTPFFLFTKTIFPFFPPFCFFGLFADSLLPNLIFCFPLLSPLPATSPNFVDLSLSLDSTTDSLLRGFSPDLYHRLPGICFLFDPLALI